MLHLAALLAVIIVWQGLAGAQGEEAGRLIGIWRSQRQTVKLWEREKSRTGVAEYLTELPPREVLAGKLHKVLEPARLGSDSLIQIQLDKKKRIC